MPKWRPQACQTIGLGTKTNNMHIQKCPKSKISEQRAIGRGRRQRAQPIRSAAPRSEVAGRARHEDKILCIAARRSLPPSDGPHPCRQPPPLDRELLKKKLQKTTSKFKQHSSMFFCVFEGLWSPGRDLLVHFLKKIQFSAKRWDPRF